MAELTWGKSWFGAWGCQPDVGRSCVLVSLGGKNVMFDCGMHMGYQDERRFPDFAYISKERRFTELIDCLIVTHLSVGLVWQRRCCGQGLIHPPWSERLGTVRAATWTTAARCPTSPRCAGT